MDSKRIGHMVGPPLRNSSQIPIIAQRVPLQTHPFSARYAGLAFRLTNGCNKLTLACLHRKESDPSYDEGTTAGV